MSRHAPDPSPDAQPSDPLSKQPPAASPDRSAQSSPQSAKGDAATEQGTRPSPEEIHERIRKPAEEEMERTTASLFFSALSAGLLIGFSFLGTGYVTMASPGAEPAAWAALVYPLGYAFVVLGRSEMFTENTLEPIIPLLHRRDRETLRQTARFWIVLLVGNQIGTLLFALAMARTPAVDAALRPALEATAVHGTAGGFGFVLYRAVFAGWLVALLTWLIASTRGTGAQLVFVWLTTAPIYALRLRHSVAGAVDAWYLAATDAMGWLEVLHGFILPAVIGNAIGGVVLVALLNWGQIATQEEFRRP